MRVKSHMKKTRIRPHFSQALEPEPFRLERFFDPCRELVKFPG